MLYAKQLHMKLRSTNALQLLHLSEGERNGPPSKRRPYPGRAETVHPRIDMPLRRIALA